MLEGVEGPNSRLLAIDDSELIHRLLKARLQNVPIEIHSAMTGEAGVAAALTLRPDVILLDLHMPDLDGFGVLRRLKADPDVRDIPVLIVSASWQTEDKVRSFELGAIDFITKPFDLMELRARVNSAVRLSLLIKMLAQKAQIDGLTGIWNRAYFDARLDQEIATSARHGQDLSVIMIDIDHFKLVNDEHGHPFGDRVLESVAATIVADARKVDVVCRYGGEEFVAVLPRTSSEKAMILAGRLRDSIAELTWYGKPELKITASFGVADLEQADTNDAAGLIAAADRALYAAKHAGRNRVHEAGQPVPQDNLAA